MGTKAKVVAWTKPWPLRVFYLIWLTCAICMLLPGCETPQAPLPDIEVEQLETNEWAGITVYYKHHQGGQAYVVLETPEDVAAYKAKVEFLVKKLEEAELRMGVHEDNSDLIGEPVE